MGSDELGPETIVHVHDPVTGMRGVLVIDNSITGPAGGGTRMVPDLTVDEVAGLARAMTYKWAIFDLPSGGAKAGIFGDPNMHPDRKREVLRAFGQALEPYLANPDYLLGVGPDMGIEATDVDEIYAGAKATNVVTWESSDAWVIDGDPAAYHLTGRGVVAAAKAALASIGRPTAGATFALEGFGQVGAGTARYLQDEDARVIAVSTLSGAIHDPHGLDIPRLLDLRREHGDDCVLRYGRGEVITCEQLFSLAADVLVPGARPRAIDAYKEAAVRARIVCPAGNLSVTEDGEERLHARGVVCVPDFIVNGGGIIACWVDIVGGGPREALDTVARMIARTTTSVLAEAKQRNRPPAATARMLMRDQILKAKRRRRTWAEAKLEAKRVLALS
jgi:glutamate dehydrogenase (NAD(P)+)